MQTGAPLAPGGVAATQTEAGFEVSWSPPSDGDTLTYDGFIVDRAVTASTSTAPVADDWEQVHEVADKEARRWVDIDVEGLGAYFYRVKAYVGNGPLYVGIDDSPAGDLRVVTAGDLTPTEALAVLPPPAVPDPNGDGMVDADDALIYYYAYSLGQVLGTGR